MSDIRGWLEELGVGQYADAFEENDITRELAALGDPRIWFVWGDGKEAGQKAHYFDGIVNHLLPTSADQEIDQSIEKALHTLLAKQQDKENGEG